MRESRSPSSGHDTKTTQETALKYRIAVPKDVSLTEMIRYNIMIGTARGRHCKFTNVYNQTSTAIFQAWLLFENTRVCGKKKKKNMYNNIMFVEFV